MSSTRTCEIPAVRFDDLELSQEQPRLLIITDPSVFWGSDQPNWTEDGILDVMSWSDVSAATGRWNRAVVVCPEVSMTDLTVGNFWHAWSHWTRLMNYDLSTELTLRFWRPEAQPDDRKYGLIDAPRQIEITFYTKEFFDLYESVAEAWEFILLMSLHQPGTHPSLPGWDYTAPMDKAPAEHFADGKVVVYTTHETGEEPTRVVVLLDQTGGRAFELRERNLDQTEDSDY